jgi:hypothetical protein
LKRCLTPVIHSCQVLDPGLDVTRFEVVTEDVKRGRQLAYSRSRIVDADRRDRVLAITQGQGISIGIPPPGLQRMVVDLIDVTDSANLPPLWQVFGGARRSDGVWTLPELSVEMASPDAALHVGPQFVVLEAGAIDHAARRAGTDRLQGLSSHVMFRARGKCGPFRFVSEAIDGIGGMLAVRTPGYDDGADSKLITAAMHVFRVVN